MFEWFFAHLLDTECTPPKTLEQQVREKICRSLIFLEVSHIMDNAPQPEERPKVTAPELLLKVVLTGTQLHYEHAEMIDDIRLDRMLQCGKQILYKSHQESDVRYVVTILRFTGTKLSFTSLLHDDKVNKYSKTEPWVLAGGLARLIRCPRLCHTRSREKIIFVEKSPGVELQWLFVRSNCCELLYHHEGY